MVDQGSTSDRHYPVRCPACGNVTGYPITVQTVRSRPGYIRIGISCHTCKEQWSQEIDTDGQ